MLQTDSTSTAAPAQSSMSDLSILKNMSFDDFISKLAHDIVNFFISVAIAIAVFYIGRFLIRKLYAFISKMMLRRRVDQSLVTFVLSLTNIVLYFILIVTVIGILGINTSSFIALFASAGVAIGMALSGTLQNFAGGVLILLLKPYKVGDYIEAQGYSGIVREIQIFSTLICTPDNKSIFIPNGGLSTGSINNWSREDYRRVEWTISLAYGDDAVKAKQAILDILLSDNRVVKGMINDDRIQRLQQEITDSAASQGDGAEDGTSPDGVADSEPAPRRTSLWDRLRGRRAESPNEAKLQQLQKASKANTDPLRAQIDGRPMVALSSLSASSIDFTARAWTRAQDYWGLYFEINERIYKELPEQGFNFPFPQMDVHLTRQ